MKALNWVGTSKDDIRSFPDGARQAAGFQLSKIQNGEDPEDWKPMNSIGPGVREIRIRERSGTFRVIYLVRLLDAVYVLHAFRKTSQKTSMQDIDLARARLRSLTR